MIAVVDIARICHEANRALQVALNDPAIPVCQEWDHEDQGIRDSAVNGVVFHLGSDATPRESHENWMRQKEAEGWAYGEKKDLDLKTHPCFVPYDELSPQDRIKDELFSSIVRVFKEAGNV